MFSYTAGEDYAWGAVQSTKGTQQLLGGLLDEQESEFRFAGDALDGLFKTQQMRNQADAYKDLAKNGGGGGGGGQSSSGGGLGSTIGAGLGFAASMLIPGAQAFTGPITGLTSSIGGLFD